MMPDYPGDRHRGDAVRRAVCTTIKEGRWVTPDPGGHARTMDMARVVAECLNV